ncbi:MAG: hypothetical protein GX804_02705, partial [Lentisphaerae bacterium]|nr:hypothetical protein [Lentisphaerota bacterium]
GEEYFSLDGAQIETSKDVSTGEIILMKSTGGYLLIKVVLPENAVSIPSIKSSDGGWEASLDGIKFKEAIMERWIGEFGFPLVTVPYSSTGDGIYVADLELYGYVTVRTNKKPRIFLAESLDELHYKRLQINAAPVEMQKIPNGSWRMAHSAFFRYFHIESLNEFSITCEAKMRPLAYRGAFHADEELNRIWMVAAYTLRLCMRDVIASGDAGSHIPPMGTLAMATIGNAHVFAEPEPARDTLRLAEQYGIGQTSIENKLWYIICHDFYQLYFSDREFLIESRENIRGIFDDIVRTAESNGGFLVGICSADNFDEGISTALQMIFIMALNSAERIADRLEDVAWSTLCHNISENLKNLLVETAFNDDEGLFFSRPNEPDSGFSRAPNFLSIVSAFAEEDLCRHMTKILSEDRMPQTTSPFMAFFEIMALYMGGRTDTALSEIRRLWGGMLRTGGTTFFELFNPDAAEKENYALGAKPFGNSLCHAASCGPLALLPLIICGLNPIADGWDDIIHDDESPVNDASLTVPTPKSNIIFNIKNSWIIREK